MRHDGRTRRAALLSVAAICSAALFGTAYAAQTGPGASQTAGKKFKNIRVLKDVPADRLIPIMHQWNASLGVGCDFCHVVETTADGKHVGFERDVKPEKAMARKMVVMAMKLNKSEKILDGKATCFMCHHGHAMPETKAPADTPPSR